MMLHLWRRRRVSHVFWTPWKPRCCVWDWVRWCSHFFSSLFHGCPNGKWTCESSVGFKFSANDPWDASEKSEALKGRKINKKNGSYKIYLRRVQRRQCCLPKSEQDAVLVCTFVEHWFNEHQSLLLWAFRKQILERKEGRRKSRATRKSTLPIPIFFFFSKFKTSTLDIFKVMRIQTNSRLNMCQLGGVDVVVCVCVVPPQNSNRRVREEGLPVCTMYGLAGLGGSTNAAEEAKGSGGPPFWSLGTLWMKAFMFPFCFRVSVCGWIRVDTYITHATSICKEIQTFTTTSSSKVSNANATKG